MIGIKIIKIIAVQIIQVLLEKWKYAVIEMFKRSMEKFGVQYRNYIGDGDSKTYSGILKAAPYGE